MFNFIIIFFILIEYFLSIKSSHFQMHPTGVVSKLLVLYLRDKTMEMSAWKSIYVHLFTVYFFHFTKSDSHLPFF